MEPDITLISGLIADPARSKILMALMAGKALTATELALEAGVTTQTTSSHLAKLLGGNLIQVRKQGRHKYFQLASYHIAELLEQLMNVSISTLPVRQTGPKQIELCFARTCYDHLAGEQGVRVYSSLCTQGLIREHKDSCQLSESGLQFFLQQGADITTMKQSKRPLCKPCLDWSERRYHLAGSLGNWLLDFLLNQQWLETQPHSRVLTQTKKGKQALLSLFPD